MEFDWALHERNVENDHEVGRETEHLFIESIEINELIILWVILDRKILSSTKMIPHKRNACDGIDSNYR